MTSIGIASTGNVACCESLGGAYVGFRQYCDSWLQLQRTYGADAVTDVYQAVLAGKTDPASGQIISMWDEGVAS